MCDRHEELKAGAHATARRSLGLFAQELAIAFHRDSFVMFARDAARSMAWTPTPLKSIDTVYAKLNEAIGYINRKS
jgi:hypothetical protein